MSVPSIALLLALPIDRASFDAFARGEALHDYRRITLGGASADTIWRKRYARIASAAQDLTAVAHSVGAAIHPCATLEDLARASARCEVLILIAHWRGWTVSLSDLRCDAPAVAVELTRAGLGRLARSAGNATSTQALVRALNGAIESGAVVRDLYPQLAEKTEHPAMLAALSRDALDEILGNAILPGNRVELYDGLHTPGAIEEAIDPAFRGELDLATCTSLALARVISSRRGLTVRIVHTVDPIDPLPCCLTIAAALRRLREHGGGYAAARLAVAGELGPESHLDRDMSYEPLHDSEDPL